MPLPKLKGGISYGWWIVIVAAPINLYVGATFFYGFSAFFNPIAVEFGWAYALISLASTFRGFESGLLAPVVGILADRVGFKKLMLVGIAIFGVSGIFLSRIQDLTGFYVISLIYALGTSLISPVVSITAIAKSFRKGTSLAMGLIMAGYAAGGLLIPGVVWIIDQFSWRTALALFGVGAWLLAIPLALFPKGPSRETPALAESRTSPEQKPKPSGLTARESLKNKDFWLLSVATLFGGIASMAIIVHQLPYLVSVGLSRQTAGFLALVFALSNVIGRLGLSWLADFIDRRSCFAIASGMQAIGVLAFALAQNVGQFIPALIVLGLGFGGVVPLRSSLQVELFGSRAFGTIQGLLMVFVTFGGMVSPPFAGWMFDTFGSYRTAFVVLGALTFIAVPAVLVITKPATNK